MMKEEYEFVANDGAVWQSDRAKTYRCPCCLRPIFSQHEGDEPPTVLCGPGGHALQWLVAAPDDI